MASTESRMATRTKGKSVVSGRPGIIDHQNNPTNTRLGERSTRRNLIRKNFHPWLNTTGPPSAAPSARPLKTSNKSVERLPKFCILKMWKWIMWQRSAEIRGEFCAFSKVVQQQMEPRPPSQLQSKCSTNCDFWNVLQTRDRILSHIHVFKLVS